MRLNGGAGSVVARIAQLTVMNDTKNVKMQIAPGTPRQLPVRNPFESPSDHSHLQEQMVLSPTLFKSTNSSATPGKFRWSIDELALINPVEIDSEDIRRQALYLSQARIDKEMEEKRQKAIEEFFTKSIIVPSPWTDHNGKQVSQLSSTRCINLSDASPVGREAIIQPGKSNAACQTVLSLPVDFDMEKILGEYYKPDELADQSQESLSTSSLRRKLFLDENGSLSSENFSPSPQSSPTVPASLGILCSIDISPVRCRSPLNTSSSGQFSSSPIQGGTRTYSLGSLPSPSFPEGNSANIASPTFSPIGIQIKKKSLTDQRQFTFRSPDIPAVSSSCRSTPAGPRNSYTECSPLKNPSPVRLVACRGAARYQSSLSRLPSMPESFGKEQEEGAKALSAEMPLPAEATINLHQFSGDGFAPGTHLVVATVSISPDRSQADQQGLALFHGLESFKENHTVEMADPEAVVGEKRASEEGGMPAAGLNLEGSCISMSAMAESSGIPCDSISLQVDSGYNTQTYTSSLMDTMGPETSCRENDVHANDTQNKFQVFKAKNGKAIPRYWTENEPACKPSSHFLEMPLSK
ncbi:protein aurora borealis isoform X1 [Varanus komodoensis]|uniref:protein aurora borealis isoform X1 n=2 Tax=Varanus komodoensis TaxID=61221 RepID=UPI001CF7A726|nr:protein aurora borealis isoform X1 [Varanus komodoensis]